MSSMAANANDNDDTNNPSSNPCGQFKSDLSNGLEPNKLPLLPFDQAEFPEFAYINSIECEPGIVELFRENKGCECADGQCVEQTNFGQKACSCKAFCVPGICECSKLAVDGVQQPCSKLFSAAVEKSKEFAYQVFYSSPKKGWGLALRSRPIEAANQFLFEYAGQLKLVNEEEEIENDDYIFGFQWQEKSFLLDAAIKGNLARFCNHSCEPNCRSILATLDNSGMPHVLIYSARPIAEGEELTLDYGENWWAAKTGLICACNSGKCKYTGKPGQDERVKWKNRGTVPLATKNCSPHRPIRQMAMATKFAGTSKIVVWKKLKEEYQLALMAPDGPEEDEEDMEEQEDVEDEEDVEEQEEDVAQNTMDSGASFSASRKRKACKALNEDNNKEGEAIEEADEDEAKEKADDDEGKEGL